MSSPRVSQSRTARNSQGKVGYPFVAYPIQIWDNHLNLSETEFKFLGYLLFRLFKSRASQIDLADSEIMDGALIGSRNSLKVARDRFLGRKWISCVASGKTRGKTTRYVILLGRQEQLFASENDVMDTAGQDSLRQKMTQSATDWVKKRRNNSFIASKKDGIDLINLKEKKSTKKKDKELRAADTPHGGSPPSHERAIPDPRHHSTEVLIKRLHREKFAGVESQWDGSEGVALRTLLAKNKSWLQTDIDRMITNFFDSEKNSGRPRTWLPNLSQWIPGPKDKFGATIGVSKYSSSNGKTARNIEALIQNSMEQHLRVVDPEHKGGPNGNGATKTPAA
jgi:hypothetical protein